MADCAFIIKIPHCPLWLCVSLLTQKMNWSHLLQRLGCDCVLMLYLQRSAGSLTAGLWDGGAEWSVREPDDHVATRAAWKHDPGWRNHEDLHHSERLCGNSTTDHGWECLFLLFSNFLCVMITWHYSFQTKVKPKIHFFFFERTIPFTFVRLFEVTFYKGVCEAWTFQNEITLVWQVFVM